MASAAGVAGVPATLEFGGKSSKCVQCGEPDSARITGNPEAMPLDQYREQRFCNAVNDRIGLEQEPPRPS